MDIVEEAFELFKQQALTLQELRLQGSSEGELTRINKPYTPEILARGGNVSIEDLNVKRLRVGAFWSHTAVMFTNKNQNAYLSLEPLNQYGETIRDPQVILFNLETQQFDPAPELTEQLYTRLKEFEGENEHHRSYIRENRSIQESEGSRHPER